MLKKIKIDTVFDAITKSCWKHGLQYETIIKNNEVIEIRLKSRREQVLFKFHKTDMVFVDDYEKFVLKMELLDIKRGVYITTGVFEGKVVKNYRRVFPFFNNVNIEDNVDFIKGQLGLWGKAAEVFKYKKLNFYRYLPN